MGEWVRAEESEYKKKKDGRQTKIEDLAVNINFADRQTINKS